jgi:NADPH:quinone reductase-like Zn-dependent oxidoreductase
VGSVAIQFAKALGARVAATAGSPEKLRLCRDLGADLAIDYKEQDFVEEVLRYDSSGADVILDNMGASYLARNMAALATSGRLVVIGLQGGAKAEVDLRALMSKRAAIISTTLRARPTAEKSAIVASVVQNAWPLVEDGTVRPIIHQMLPLTEVASAHRVVEAGGHVGKVVLTT